jgi:hypothetical protein
LVLSDDGLVPNNPMPLLIYKRADSPFFRVGALLRLSGRSQTGASTDLLLQDRRWRGSTVLDLPGARWSRILSIP